MRKRGIRVLTLFVVLAASLAVPPPTARALPRDYIIINYYDCDWEFVGYEFRDCSGHWSWGGNPGAGLYRTTDQEECTGPPVSFITEQKQYGTGVWEPWNGGTSPLCSCIAQGAC
jgi:hypothetical protein